MTNSKTKAVKKALFLPLILFLGVCACKTPLQKQAVQKPNIILIMTDDQGWFDVGFNGNKKIKTPFI
ncbi:MAG: N-acetylgalactosamine 6-sulfate sulfatase, partial [Allomuricauda sp.]